MSEQTKLDLSKPVQTRDGRPVTLWERRSNNRAYPVVGVISHESGRETAECWTADGKYSVSLSDESHFDLINVPPRKVKREGWVAIVNGKAQPHIWTSPSDFICEHGVKCGHITWEEDEAQP